MRVLFISREHRKTLLSPIVKNQGESLKEIVELDFFTIKGRGVKGYLNSIFTIREYLKENQYDIVHAHFWLSGIVASLAGAKPLVVSLMGDDVKKNRFKWVIPLFGYFFWSSIIVKSKDMYNALKIKKAHIVPNGVDMSRFIPIKREVAMDKLGWDREKKHILFASDPNRVEKNFQLVEKALAFLDNNNLELHYLKDIPNEDVFYHYNASSVVLLSSLWEGSPNAIKEAMACNVPIVSTDVGDVKEILSQTKGCYISSYDYKEFASLIGKALDFNKRTTGREDIKYLKSELIAKKIVDIYKNIKGI